jgi:hypothetical protein
VVFPDQGWVEVSHFPCPTNGNRDAGQKLLTQRYRQNYATLHPDSTYIARFDLPKIANLKTIFPTLYRDDPVLVAY